MWVMIIMVTVIEIIMTTLTISIMQWMKPESMEEITLVFLLLSGQQCNNSDMTTTHFNVESWGHTYLWSISRYYIQGNDFRLLKLSGELQAHLNDEVMSCHRKRKIYNFPPVNTLFKKKSWFTTWKFDQPKGVCLRRNVNDYK